MTRVLTIEVPEALYEKLRRLERARAVIGGTPLPTQDRITNAIASMLEAHCDDRLPYVERLAAATRAARRPD